MCSKNLEDLRKRQKLDKLLLFLFSVNLYLCVNNFLISFLTFFSLLNFRKQSHKLLTVSSSSFLRTSSNILYSVRKYFGPDYSRKEELFMRMNFVFCISYLHKSLALFSHSSSL
jgi:hypothetical protein